MEPAPYPWGTRCLRACACWQDAFIRAQIASVPGVHPVRAGERPRWGHLRLRWLLQTQPASAALPPGGA